MRINVHSSSRDSRHSPLWLFGLLWVLAAGPVQGQPAYRAIPLNVPKTGKTGFRLLPPSETGITFTNSLALSRALTNQNLMNGSGVAAGDVDGDGLCDLYFCGLDVPNRLYRNKGNWKFEDITAAAGVACAGQPSTGAVFADVDGDGDLDLLVTSLGGGVRLFINDGHGRFTERTDAAGLRSQAGSTSMALADFDGDGALDLYVTDIPRRPVRNELTSVFQIKEINGVRQVVAVNGTPATSPELAGRFRISPRGEVLEYGEADQFFRNNGNGTFTALSFTDGRFLDEDGHALKETPMDWGLAVQFRDFNGDGLPDLYVCNDLFTPDRFWINQGGGRFRALPRLALRHTSLASMGVDAADIDRDGHYDIFTSDMLSRDRKLRQTQFAHVAPRMWPDGVIGERLQFNHNCLLLNRGDMTYAEISFFSGVAASDWSWGGIFLDVDLDGYEDLLIPTGQQRNFAHADFVTRVQALRRGGAKASLDGMVKTAEEYPPLAVPKMAFRNRGDLTFEEIGAAWGFDTRGASTAMALADLDNDGDMDLVLNNLNAPAGIYRNEGVAPRIAVRLKGAGQNTAGIGAQIKVTGGPVPQQQEMICGGRYLSCDQALRVFATGKAEKVNLEVQWRSGKRSVVAGALPNYLYEIYEPTAPGEAPHEPGNKGRLLSPSLSSAASGGEGARRAGEEESRFSVSLPAQSRKEPPQKPPARSAVSDRAVDGQGDAAHATAPPDRAISETGQQTYFEDVSSRLNHTHVESPFNDFELQPLLPYRLVRSGPGVTWFDLNGDGWDDLVIPGGQGGSLAAFLNQRGGDFKTAAFGPATATLSGDQTTVLGWQANSSTPVLVAGLSKYKPAAGPANAISFFNVAASSLASAIADLDGPVGPLALADVDGDGNVDLFVGTTAKPGRHPEPGSGYLFRNQGGSMVLDQHWERLGVVKSAVFSDLDGDGFPELIVACEWGPLRIFHNDHGRFTEWNPPVQFETPSAPRRALNDVTGFWQGVTAADFDGDGRLDLAVANWGLNSGLSASVVNPKTFYYGDLDGNGTVEILEVNVDPATGKEYPAANLNVLLMGAPFLRERIPDYESYSRMTIQELLGDALAKLKRLEIRTLASTVFLNRGDHFEAHQLPAEAQFTPACGIVAADLDGDGAEDLFLSQNSFVVGIGMTRQDAGRGLWLRGDGKGGFHAVPGQTSGLLIYGEQRGCAVSDFDHDGRVDLAVAQNNGETKLYRNRGAAPGIRVRLRGPAGNPTGIGAVMRTGHGGKWGPAREVHAGSGRWSMDSAVQVLSRVGTPDQLLVRWPGGRTSVSEVPAEAREITVDYANAKPAN